MALTHEWRAAKVRSNAVASTSFESDSSFREELVSGRGRFPGRAGENLGRIWRGPMRLSLKNGGMGVRPCLEAAGVVVWQGCMLRGFTASLALHTHDEPTVIAQGRAILDGAWPDALLGWAPIESLAYAGLQLLPLPAVPLSDVMLVLCAVLAPLALWWMLRAIVPAPAAFLSACAWGSSSQVLQHATSMAPPTVYVFVSCFYFVAIGCAVRGHGKTAFVLACCACMERGELTLWFLTAAVLLSWTTWRRLRRLPIPQALVMVTAIGLFVLHQSVPSCRGKSWLAFQQHYAMTTAQRQAGAVNRAAATHAFAHPTEIMDRDFPGASSIPGALLSNPRAFAAHLIHNACRTPSAILTVLLGTRLPPSPLRASLLLLIAVLVLLGLVRGWSSFRCRWRSLPTAARSAFLTVPALVTVALVIHPTPSYLLPLSALWIPGVALLACAGCSSTPLLLRARRVLTVAIPLATLLAAPLAPRNYPVTHGNHRLIRQTLAILERNAVSRNARTLLFGADPVSAYRAHDREALVEVRRFVDRGPETLQRVLDTGGVDYIYLNMSFVPWLGPLIQVLQAELDTDRWELVDLNSFETLFRRSG